MKRCLLVISCIIALPVHVPAQQPGPEAPATKEDVEKYLEAMHSREMMAKMMDAMLKPMHQMVHEQYLRDKDKLPADFEARVNKLMDDSMKAMPMEEILEAMVPVYQKHLNKGDIDALVAFYSSPTGQKLIRELPAITAESTQAMMPLLQKRTAVVTQRVQQEVTQMVKEAQSKPNNNPQR